MAASRLARLWQPGAPQSRAFLPDFWMAAVQSPEVGRYRLPPNCIKFECDPKMSKHDIREYLEKVYDAPVRSVRTEVQMGEVFWNQKVDYRYKKALWRDEDKKYAYVFMKKDFSFIFPQMFTDNEEAREIDLAKKQQDQAKENSVFANSDRGGVGNLLP